MLVAGWHDIIDVKYYEALKGQDVMEVEGLIPEHGYHHKLESSLSRKQLIEKIVSAYDAFKKQFPTIYKTQIETIEDQYFK